MDNLTLKPEATVLEASGSWAATKATYDFWDSPYIKPDQIRQAHIDSTLERIREYDCVLAIQDTTEFNYSNHPATVSSSLIRLSHSFDLFSTTFGH
ncbi:MAG: hypothetical protein GDA44_09555 [Prochloron sp. SP5CPC1]|nr:hypothetical protein [Candidatus Paraprochloron terpiosi SP5CPC1]